MDFSCKSILSWGILPICNSLYTFVVSLAWNRHIMNWNSFTPLKVNATGSYLIYAAKEKAYQQKFFEKKLPKIKSSLYNLCQTEFFCKETL